MLVGEEKPRVNVMYGSVGPAGKQRNYLAKITLAGLRSTQVAFDSAEAKRPPWCGKQKAMRRSETKWILWCYNHH